MFIILVNSFHQCSSAGGFFVTFFLISEISPLLRWITRSAMPAISTLCVMITVVVPSSRLTRSSASRTTTPVSESSAPVGSSQSSTAGFFEMARAIATRCCSPPESWDGKWSSRSPRLTRPSASSGFHRRLRDFGDCCDIFAGRQARDKVIELEDKPDREPAVIGQLLSVARVRSVSR